MTWLRPEVVATAGDTTIGISVVNRLPPPEPAVADCENDGRNAQGPDEEVESHMPARVDGLPASTKEEEEGDGIVD